MLTLVVPTGIGDCSWIYSKIVNLGRPVRLKICENNALNRASGFLDLLPGIENGGYQDLSYHTEFIVKKRGLAPDTDLRALPDGEYFLSANAWLDAGNRLETFLPSLETTFHYELRIPELHGIRMRKVVGSMSAKPLIAIYTSKYCPPQTGWHFWSSEEWARFCKLVNDHLGGACFVFLGAKFDTTIGHKAAELVGQFAEAKNMIGETEVGEAIELIKLADYLVAFPSGMGILGDVVKTPTMMFLPSPRHDKLKDAYADPESIASDRHMNVMYCKVEDAFEIWKARGAKHMGVKA